MNRVGSETNGQGHETQAPPALPTLSGEARPPRLTWRTKSLPFFLFFLFCLFKAAPAAYGGSQARDRIQGVASGLSHSHSNVGSEPCL